MAETQGNIYYMLYPGGNEVKYAKDDGECEYEYVEGQGWVASGILLDFMWPDAPLFGEYREMSYEEAEVLFKSKGIPM